MTESIGNHNASAAQDSCIEPDYPAAHSMDTEWFAVDKDGFVAVLYTNEEGAVPVNYSRMQEGADDILESIAEATGVTPTENKWGMVAPESLGLYSYMCEMGVTPSTEELSEEYLDDTTIVTPYKREAVPESPLHISQLPKDLQQQLSEIAFKDTSYKETEWIQPALKMQCEMWQEEYSEAKIVNEKGEMVALPLEMNFQATPRKTD